MDLLEAALARARQRPCALFRLQGRGGDPLPGRQRLRRLQRRERRLSAGHLRRGRRHRRHGRRRPHRDRRGAGGRRRPGARSRPAAAAARSSPSSRRPETPVILAGLEGERARTTVGALLPGAFTPDAPGGGGAMTRPARRRGPGARLPRPHQPRRRLRRGRDQRALPPRPDPARAGGGGLHLAATSSRRRRRELADTGIRVATVVNFPAGDDPLEEVRAETREALADGADEIDFVVPWRMIAWRPPRGGRRLGARDQGHLRPGDAQGDPRDRRAQATPA